MNMYKRTLVLPVYLIEDVKPDWLYANDRCTYKVVDSSTEKFKLVICTCPIKEEAELIVNLINSKYEVNK